MRMNTFAAMIEARKDPYAAWRYPAFRYFVSGKLLLTIALQMQAIVASWLIYESTKDPLSLGLIGLTEAIPAIGLALPGGHLADRFSRWKILMLTTGLVLVANIVLTAYALSYTASGIWPVYAVIFLIGIARGFYNPAQSALWPQLVERKDYVNVSVWNSSMWQIGAVTGPALGGISYAVLGPAGTTIIVCILIVLTLIVYGLIGNYPPPEGRTSEPIMDSLKAGVRFVFSERILLSAISLDLFAVLFGGAVALLPVFAAEVLHTGPEGLGLLRSAPAIGAVIMAAVLAYFPPNKNAGLKMIGCVAIFGLCMIGFALSTSFIVSFAMLLLSGMVDNVSVVIRSTIMQLKTPEAMRGRVSAVNSIFVGSSNEIGAFESGAAAKIFGLVPSVVIGGVMTLLVTATTYKVAPQLKKLDL
jgi:MFS family permease